MGNVLWAADTQNPEAQEKIKPRKRDTVTTHPCYALNHEIKWALPSFRGEEDKAGKDSTLQNKYPLEKGREGEKWKEEAETRENWVQIQAQLYSAYPCLFWSLSPVFPMLWNVTYKVAMKENCL